MKNVNNMYNINIMMDFIMIYNNWNFVIIREEILHKEYKNMV